MVRKGWRAVATPSGWYEVIRGPRPPSAQRTFQPPQGSDKVSYQDKRRAGAILHIAQRMRPTELTLSSQPPCGEACSSCTKLSPQILPDFRYQDSIDGGWEQRALPRHQPPHTNRCDRHTNDECCWQAPQHYCLEPLAVVTIRTRDPVPADTLGDWIVFLFPSPLLQSNHSRTTNSSSNRSKHSRRSRTNQFNLGQRRKIKYGVIKPRNMQKRHAERKDECVRC